MGPLQTQTFWREIQGGGDLGAAIAAVQGEANAFLAALNDWSQVRDIQMRVSPIRKYEDNFMVCMTVTYLQE